MLTLMIALLVQNTVGQKWAVTEDKAKNQKSIVVVMESSGGTNQSKVNKLIINSTYDDSIFISTFLKHGANVTVIQDGKSEVNIAPVVVKLPKVAGKPVVKRPKVTVKPTVKPREVKIHEKLKKIEQRAEKILLQPTRNVNQTSLEINKLLAIIYAFQKTLTMKGQEGTTIYLTKIAEKLGEHYETIQTSDEDKKLKKMVNALERSLNVTQANNEPPDNLENLDKISEMTRALAIRTGDVGLRNYALKIVQAFEIAMEPFRAKNPDLSESLAKIVTSIREDYFDSENATVLNGYIDQLNELQTKFRTPEKLTLVKSLKREIVNLTEAIHVIETVDDVLEAEEEQFKKLFSIETIQKLMVQLKAFIESGRNKQMQSEADDLYSELVARVNDLMETKKKSANFVAILDAINQTLIDYNGLGGRDGLHMIEDKINFVLEKTNDQSVKSKAMTLLAIVKSMDEKVDNVLKVFDLIEGRIRVPGSNKEADALELAISQIKQIAKKVNDQTVATRAMKIIGQIEKFLNSHKFLNQIKKIEEALNSMNESLAIAETEEEVDEDREQLEKIESSVMKMQKLTPAQQRNVTKVLQKIESIKRTIPSGPQVNGIFKHEVREFIKILNGFQDVVMPEMSKNLDKIKKSFELLKKFKRVNLDALKDRMQIATKDHKRITYGLQSIKQALRKFGLTKSDFKEKREFKSFDDTLDRMFDLERLQEDPATNDLLKKAFTIVQEVLHANDTLKQLQRMIIFNTKILNSNDKGQAMTEETKPAPVPITKVSLFPLIPDEDVDGEAKVPKVENTATEASDLDKAVVKSASSKNSSEITAAA